ncbi:BRCA1-associated RING domain protein 1 [Branchiostoma belcheri]|nr:BRCA1-associated RING domain protein 1 [Branchiostoma belcheri]
MATESGVWAWDHTKEALAKLECLLKCGKCGHLLKEPCSLGSCEHLFCRSCVWQDVGNSCPVCDMPAWVRDVQTNRRLEALVSLTGQLRAVLDGTTAAEPQEEDDMEKTGQKTEGISMSNAKIKIQEQEAGTKEDHIGVMEEMTDDQPVEQDHKGVMENMPDDEPCTDQPKTVLKETPAQGSPQKNSSEENKEDIPELQTPTKDQGKKATKKRGGRKQKCQVTMRARTKKSYAEDNDSSEAESEKESVSKPPDPLSVFDFHGSPTQGLADKNQQWGFSDSGRKKKQGRRSSPWKSQLENSLVRRVCFAMEKEEKCEGTRNEGTEEAAEEEEMEQMRNEGMEEAEMEVENCTGVGNEGMEEAVTEDMSVEDEESKEPAACEATEDQSAAVKNKTVKRGKKIPDGHPEGVALQEEESKEEEEVTTEVENSSTPEDIEMLQELHTGKPQEQDTASPSGEQTGKKRRRTSGRLSDRDKSVEKVGTSTRGNENSPQSCDTPKADLKKRGKSPVPRKALLSEQDEDSTPLKKVHKKVNSSLEEDDEESADTLRRKVDNRDKTRGNVTKDEGRVSLSPVTTPQSKAGSKGRRSSVLTPRGHRSSPRGSPGHVMKRNVRGETPLHLAAIKGDAETVLHLLKEGADPNVRDNAGWTPLHEASNHGHTHVAEVLLDHGALINTTAFENDSPLHDAVANGRVEVARLLVSRGASLDVRNKLGFLPGDLATTDAMLEALSTKPLHTQPQVVMTTSSQVGQVVALATGLDNKQREALEQCMLVLDGKVVKTFSDQVTHLVTACDEAGHCPRTIKYLRGVLTGKWIVSFKWVSACLEQQQCVPEGPYEVLGTTAKPGSTGASKGRINKEQQLPGLFDGCHFFLHGKFQSPTPPRKELLELIADGGGGVLTREPKPDSDCLQASTTVAYHARKDSDLAHCSHFILYDEKSAKTPPRIRTAKLCSVPVSWLMDCVTVFSLMELPD